jgi:hypothetical protein
MRLAPAVIVLGVAATARAVAGQPGAVVDLWGAPSVVPPADSGKPMIFTPPTIVPPRPAEDCLPGMPCGMRLLGTVRRNGAVELQVPALRW